jgi:hypothetical protein
VSCLKEAGASVGKCASVPVADGAACDDGKHCTEKEACQGGACAGGKAKACDDGNVCTWDGCSEAAKGCTTLIKSGGCSDGDGCTIGDACSGGKCLPGKAKLCNDWKPCTADSCDGKSGACVYAPIAGCDATCAKDADCPASKAACQVNVCAGGKQCVTQPLANNTACDDGSACTALDLCLSGACAGLNATSCDDKNPCTVDTCDAKTGACANTPASGPCQDGDACTSGDTCAAGGCVAGAAKPCSDGNACTSDSCNKATGACVFAPIPGCGGYCTEAKHCGDDGNPCTTATCNAQTKKCAAKWKADNTLCDDGSACSGVSFCKQGKCAGANWKSCKDDDACTSDGCDGKTGGCVFAPKTGGVCSDGSYCTSADACKDGKCVGKPKTCDDKQACTADSCNAKTGGCIYTPIPGCGPYCGKSEDCKDDGNPCTTHTCNATTKLCQKGYAAKGAACDDGKPCTTADSCKYGNGVCYGGPTKACGDDNPCTSDSCDPASGKCNHAHNALACNDGDPCTYNDKCAGGACLPGTKKVCNDGKPCTADSCDGKTGACLYTPSAAAGCCADDKQCADDGDACTVAWCDKNVSACKHKAGNSGQPCSDGDGCSVGETCSSGKCFGGKPKDCGDGEPCTDDLCDPESGKCFQVFNSKPCDDGNKCTTTSVCKEGKCPAGTPNKTCLAKPCFTVACNAGTGACEYTPIPDCK